MKRQKKHRLVAEINVVPYIDVMLVLLIIFMVTAPLLMTGVQVELPEAAATPIDKYDEPLIVSIRKDGTLYINLGKDKERQQTLDKIKVQVERVLKAKPKTAVLVWGDKSVAYGKVVELMAHLQEVGADSVGLVTEPNTK
jgi:biopolymer transport protein TolR